MHTPRFRFFEDGPRKPCFLSGETPVLSMHEGRSDVHVQLKGRPRCVLAGNDSCSLQHNAIWNPAESLLSSLASGVAHLAYGATELTMTVNAVSPSRHSSASGRAPKSCTLDFGVSVLFTSEGVRVVVQQRDELEQSARRTYNSAQRQCCNHMLSYPPKGFDVAVSGRMSAPVIEVSIQKRILQHLPLLADIVGSTEAEAECSEKEASSEILVPVQISLPCSIWGLVSLLILIEGPSLTHWFRSDSPDCDSSLPVQTLEVRWMTLLALLQLTCWAFLRAASGNILQRQGPKQLARIVNTTPAGGNFHGL
jgi:hypothetical protein